MEMRPSARYRQGTARSSRPFGRETGFRFAHLQSLTKGAKAAGPSVILNEDDTDPAARQAAITEHPGQR
jgi:hypothetical protein